MTEKRVAIDDVIRLMHAVADGDLTNDEASALLEELADDQ